MKTDPIISEDIKNIALTVKSKVKTLDGATLLVTGGSGFLGSYIIDTIDYLNKNFFKKPCNIISIDNYITSQKRRRKVKNVKEINHNIIKPITIREKIDYIIHAAGIASPVYYRKYPLETIEVAVAGVKNMLDLARRKKTKSILYFSSSEIYGNPTKDAIPTKEEYNGNVSPIGPRACYDESKRLGETICMTYFNQWNVPIKIVRPFNIYGPRMRMKDYRVIPSFIYSALKKKPIPVHANGRQTRTFCYITDAMTAVFLVLMSKNGGQVYNIGNSNEEINMNSLAKKLEKAIGMRLNIKNVKYPEGYPADEPQRRCPDLSKIHANLGYEAKIDLKTGLLRTYNWCKTNWNLDNEK